MINKALNRYAQSNIPIRYWKLEFEDKSLGDPILLKNYKEITGDLDKAYRDGKCICFAGEWGRGKQLSLETELPTPNGFIKLNDLKRGDELFDELGNICKVIKLHPINISPESYEIEFDDGLKVEACAEHRWLTWTLKERANNGSPKVRTTKEILNTLKVGGRDYNTNHSIACARPINYKEKYLPIDPYVLGAWLGDGTAADGSIECADKQIINEIKKAGYKAIVHKSTKGKSKSVRYRIGKIISHQTEAQKKHGMKSSIGRLAKQLNDLDLICNKHIPEIYMYSSVEQRISLLQGLLDTDGSCDKNGKVEFSTVLPALAEQICQLILSLGIKTKVRKNKSYLNGKICKDRYRITFTTKMPVFRLKRKLKNIRLKKQQERRTTHRYIVKIAPIKPKPMRCITVDSPSHLFLITRSFLPTHNTMTCTTILKRAVEKGYSCLYVTLNDIVANMLSNSSEDKSVARRELLMVDFLVIDEFDPRYMATNTAADLFGRTMEDIFRTRAQNVLPTFLCTNSPNVIDSFTGAIKQSIGSLMNYVEMVPVLGKDLRKEGL